MQTILGHTGTYDALCNILELDYTILNKWVPPLGRKNARPKPLHWYKK